MQEFAVMSNEANTSPFSLATIAPLLGNSNPSEDDVKRLLGMLPENILKHVKSIVSDEPKTERPTEMTTEVKTEAPPPPPPFPAEPSPVVEAPKESPKIVLPEFALRPPPGFKELDADYPLYDPVRCGDRGILGVLLRSIELPKQTSAGRALIIRTLQPTLVVDHAGRVFESKVGQDILLEVSHWLRSLVRRAHDPENVGEVWLKPGERRACDGGDFIFDWSIWYGRLYPRAQFEKAA